MDGALIIDKPPGITSHDVVAAVRRMLREKRIGHAGTLDPLATGVLVLMCGRATRLARFLSASEKSYDATILFGISTDTYDVTGATTARSDVRPERVDIERALDSLRGEYLQEPPAFSARKVDGQRAYALARRQAPVALEPSRVVVSHLELTTFEPDRAALTLTCSAGFYVRSLAHTLGQLVGSGACLEALRRTRSGGLGIDDAVSLARLQEAPNPGALLVPMEGLLGSMPEIRLTEMGRTRVAHGRVVEPEHIAPGTPLVPHVPAGHQDASNPMEGWVRLVDSGGHLVAVGRLERGALHPSVVLI